MLGRELLAGPVPDTGLRAAPSANDQPVREVRDLGLALFRPRHLEPEPITSNKLVLRALGLEGHMHGWSIEARQGEHDLLALHACHVTATFLRARSSSNAQPSGVAVVTVSERLSA